MFVKFLVYTAIVFLLVCWVTAIANVFAKDSKRFPDLEERKYQLRERMFFFVVFVFVTAMLFGLVYILVGGVV